MASSSTWARSKLSNQLSIKKDPVERNLVKQSFGSQNKQIGIFNMLIFQRQLYKGYCPLHFLATVLFSVIPLFLNQSCLKSYMLLPKSKIITLVNWNEWDVSGLSLD